MAYLTEEVEIFKDLSVHLHHNDFFWNIRSCDFNIFILSGLYNQD